MRRDQGVWLANHQQEFEGSAKGRVRHTSRDICSGFALEQCSPGLGAFHEVCFRLRERLVGMELLKLFGHVPWKYTLQENISRVHLRLTREAFHTHLGLQAQEEP